MNAVVFAYHDVGVRCLKVLLARGVRVALVVTHEDNPTENIWFNSVAGVCREYGIPYITPDDPKSPQLFTQVQAAQPDFIFSFYYRHMLPVNLLALAKHGAYNMHGSLLPKYRGRVPINWAVLHGETETGATLHEMAPSRMPAPSSRKRQCRSCRTILLSKSSARSSLPPSKPSGACCR